MVAYEVFIVQTLLQQAKHSKRKLYTCFVDFKNAFDLVPRSILWRVLQKCGMEGRLLTSLKTMYTADNACVLTAQGPTERFGCGIGVKRRVPNKPLAVQSVFGRA